MNVDTGEFRALTAEVARIAEALHGLGEFTAALEDAAAGQAVVEAAYAQGRADGAAAGRLVPVSRRSAGAARALVPGGRPSHLRSIGGGAS